MENEKFWKWKKYIFEKSDSKKYFFLETSGLKKLKNEVLWKNSQYPCKRRFLKMHVRFSNQ